MTETDELRVIVQDDRHRNFTMGEVRDTVNAIREKHGLSALTVEEIGPPLRKAMTRPAQTIKDFALSL